MTDTDVRGLIELVASHLEDEATAHVAQVREGDDTDKAEQLAIATVLRNNAAWVRASALERLASPTGEGEPVAGYLHTLHMEGGQTQSQWAGDDADPTAMYGRKGADYSPEYHVTVEPLYRASPPQAATESGAEAVEPAAWRFRKPPAGPWNYITTSADVHAEELRASGWTVELLFTRPPQADGLRAYVIEAIDLLTERVQGSPARSAAHNARIRLESALAATSGEEGQGK